MKIHSTILVMLLLAIGGFSVKSGCPSDQPTCCYFHGGWGMIYACTPSASVCRNLPSGQPKSTTAQCKMNVHSDNPAEDVLLGFVTGRQGM